MTLREQRMDNSRPESRSHGSDSLRESRSGDLPWAAVRCRSKDQPTRPPDPDCHLTAVCSESCPAANFIQTPAVSRLPSSPQLRIRCARRTTQVRSELDDDGGPRDQYIAMRCRIAAWHISSTTAVYFTQKRPNSVRAMSNAPEKPCCGTGGCV